MRDGKGVSEGGGNLGAKPWYEKSQGGDAVAQADLQVGNVILSHASMVLVFACMFGVLANAASLPALASLYLVAGYFTAFTAARYVSRKAGFIVWAAGHAVQVKGILIVLGALVFAGFLAFSLVGEAQAGVAHAVLCATGCLMGVHGSAEMSLWYQFNPYGQRIKTSQSQSICMCLGCAAALLVMLLQGEIRLYAFGLLCVLASVVSAVSGMRAGNRTFAPGTLAGKQDSSHDLDMRTHVYWVALMFAFGLAYAVGFRYWTEVLGLAVLVANVAVAALFPWFKRKFRSNLGESARIYLPLCVLAMFALASARPEALAFAMSLAVVFLLYQGLSNISFLVNYALHFNENIIMKLSEGRFPPLLGLTCGIVAGLAYDLVVPVLGGALLVVLPCAATMFVVAAYAVQSFNQGNPVSKGVVRDLEQGIETPWRSENGQEMEAFKQRCYEFAEKRDLTPRESEVFFLLACGYNTVSIAEVLTVSPSTVKTHFYRIYNKVGMHSQQEIVIYMREKAD